MPTYQATLSGDGLKDISADQLTKIQGLGIQVNTEDPSDVTFTTNVKKDKVPASLNTVLASAGITGTTVVSFN